MTQNEMIYDFLKKHGSIDDEEWREIPGLHGFYSISNYGRLKRNKRKYLKGNKYVIELKEKELKPNFDNHGYLQTRLMKDGKRINYRIHRLVAMAFIPNQNNYREINHIDGIKTNNYYKNLEWCSRKQNVNHAFKTGLINTNKKIAQIGLNGNIIKIWNSISEASEITGAKKSNISYCCKHNNRKAKGFKWKYLSEINKC